MTKPELENLKVPDLKEIAKNLGIVGYDSLNKAKLIAAILGPENVIEKAAMPLNKIPGKYLKFNNIEKEN
jgi:hypothetical protein